MGDFFSTLVGGVEGWFGQQEVPDLQNKSPSELIAGIPVGQLAKKQNKFNWMTGPENAKIASSIEDMFDPRVAALRHLATDTAYKDLQDPYAIPADVQNEVIRKTLERTGPMGAMQAGRNLVAADLGLTSLDLFNNRLNRAMQIVRSSPSWSNLFQPDRSLSPATGLQLELNQQDEQNQQNVFLAELESANNQSLIRGTLTNDIALAGTAYGAMTGMSGIGAASGGSGPVATPGTYGGAGQPSYSTLRHAAPTGTKFI